MNFKKKQQKKPIKTNNIMMKNNDIGSSIMLCYVRSFLDVCVLDFQCALRFESSAWEEFGPVSVAPAEAAAPDRGGVECWEEGAEEEGEEALTLACWQAGQTVNWCSICAEETI